MSGRSPLLVLATLIAVSAVLYFVFVSPGTTPTVEPPDVRGDTERGSQSPSDAEPRHRGVETDPATNVPPAQPAEEATPPAADSGPVDIPPSIAPATHDSPTGAHAPERVRMGTVNWHRVPAMNAVNEILRETGLRLEASQDAQKVLDRARVTLDLENKSAAYVLGMVLLPHSLGFTVREDRLLIFVEDD